MNYAAQQRYLSQSRVWGMLAAVALLGIAAAGIVTGQNFNQTQAHVAQPPSAVTIISALIVVALAFSILYTPDYLQLTVNPEKRFRWQIKIRWRVIGTVLVLGLFVAHRQQARLILLGAVAWLVIANLLARKAVSSRGGPQTSSAPNSSQPPVGELASPQLVPAALPSPLIGARSWFWLICKRVNVSRLIS